MASSWSAYNELAWTEEWLADPADYEREVGILTGLLRGAAGQPLGTLLHLGCGAGGHDTFFKRDFTVTGVDLSQGMLAMARGRHPEIEYIEGDLRTVRLGRRFDAVVIPDCIDYMVTREELRLALGTAAAHLGPGGVLLVVGKTAEQFQDNNFAYTGERDGIQVTVLENNYVNPWRPETYEATLVYLVRRRGELTLHTDRHLLGLFPLAAWEEVFREAGMAMERHGLDGLYDAWLLEGGAYPMTAFLGRMS